MAVAISRRPPYFYRGRVDQRLAPSWELLFDYKSKKIDASGYKRKFLELLHERKLNPVVVANGFPDGTILLCYERPEDFCHRHLVADWLMANNQNLIVKELEILTPQDLAIQELVSF